MGKRPRDSSRCTYIIAVKEINEVSNLLSGHQFEVVPVRVPQCAFSDHEGIVPFFEELTSNHNIMIGIVGYFCHNNYCSAFFSDSTLLDHTLFKFWLLQ